MTRRIIVFSVSLLLIAPFVQAQDLAGDMQTFQRVFQRSRIFPEARVKEVLALPAGKRLEVDTDGDGDIDEVWYMDTDTRHTKEVLLVCAVDEDGDYAETGLPDKDSDVYFWDWEADGVIDVVTDYQDDDGDNDLDQMGIFYEKSWKDKKDDITVWWAVDIGDDNMLWFDVNGTYIQSLCQWRTHFSGDELFYQFRLSTEDERWVNVWEDPFAFYDPDDDLCSEVVVRISAVGHAVKNLRYSIDADDDAFGRRTHNYDFSVTALPPESGLSAEAPTNESLTIRGVETHPAVPWSETKNFGQNAAWERAMLSWDEINSNTDSNPENDLSERWEGVLNNASKHGDFEQVGGPPCGKFNKRVEVTLNHTPPIRLYYDKGDHRFHLQGAEYGYLDIDYNLDGKTDASYTWKDTDNDGKLDRREADMDQDGAIDFVQDLKGGKTLYALEFEAVSPTYKKSIATVLEDSQAFIDAALTTLGGVPTDVQEIIDFYAGPLADYHLEREVGLDIQNTPAGARFYMELVRDRLFVHVRKMNGMEKMETAYYSGDYAKAAKTLSKVPAQRSLECNGQSYTKRVAVEIKVSNPAFPRYEGDPVTLSVADLIAKSPDKDFNPENCVVVDGNYWLAWRVIPHQVDTFNFGNAPALSFLADIKESGKKTYYIYYKPTGKQNTDYPKLTNAGLNQPTYVAWESDAGSYRFYTGQFDYFGKQESRAIPRVERTLYPLIDVNHHLEQPWGIDALHVNKTSGLGGMTLHVDGKTLPIQSPAGDGYVIFEHKVLGSGPVRAAVELTAANVFQETPDKIVTLRCFSYAGRQESEIQVRLPEGLNKPQLALGLLHLNQISQPFANPAMGYIGEWGRQGDDIGTIGLAVIAPKGAARKVLEVEGEQRLLCDVLPAYGTDDPGPHFRYWINGTWRRGMQFPITPTVENWERSVNELAQALQKNITIK